VNINKFVVALKDMPTIYRCFFRNNALGLTYKDRITYHLFHLNTENELKI